MGRECKLVNAHVFADKDEHVFFFVYDCAMDHSPLVKKYRRFAVYVNDKQLYSGTCHVEDVSPETQMVPVEILAD